MSEVTGLKRYLEITSHPEFSVSRSYAKEIVDAFEALKAERDKLLAQCAELRAVQQAQIEEWKAQGVEVAIAQAFREGIPVNRMQFIARMTAFAASLRRGGAE